MRIQLPEKVNYIVDELALAGFEAFAVGGCVRDSMLGREPLDWDITTSAKPEQVKNIFNKTIETGIIHGTVTVLIEKEGFEVTTYRIDGEYEDARHPKDVIFTSNLIEDLRRRDFTINAMAYNDRCGLIDEFGGMQDLTKRRIRCVGTAKERFMEDALRMLRAVRFAAQLNFEIEKETYDAIKNLSCNLKKISAERIRVELVKLLNSQHPDKFLLIYDRKLTKIFMPEFDRYMEACPDQCKKLIQSIQYVPPDQVLRLTMLLHDISSTLSGGADHAKESATIAVNILRRLKFDNHTIKSVSKLISLHEERPKLSPQDIRIAINKANIEQYSDLLVIKRGICMGLEGKKKKEEMDYLDAYETIYLKIIKDGDCLNLNDLAISGKDLIEAGIKPGERLGMMLKDLLELVLLHPEYNNSKTLIEKLKDWA